MGFIAGPIKHLPGTNVNDPQFGQGTCKIGYFAPLKGIAGIDSQSRSVNHAGYGEAGTQDGAMGLWQTASHAYTDGQYNLVHVIYTYTQATATSPASVSQSPNPIPADWNETGAVDYSDQYTQDQCNQDGLVILEAAPWVHGGGIGAALIESTVAYAPSFSCLETKYRFSYPVVGKAGDAHVKFRWRKRSDISQSETENGVTSNSSATTYGDEQSETVALSTAVQINRDSNGNLTGDYYAYSDYYTVLASDMQNGESVSIIGPSDSSYLLLDGDLLGLSVKNYVLGFQANANNGGFSAYIQPQIMPGQTIPLALYSVETATTAPGVTTDFSGRQSITSNSTPGNDGNGNPLPTSTRTSTLSAPALPYQSDINGRQSGRVSFPGNVVGLTPTTIQFKNGLILTLSQPVNLDTVAADCTSWLSSTLTALRANAPQDYSTATPPPASAVPPLPFPVPSPVWISEEDLQPYLASGNGPFGTANVYLLALNWTSDDTASIEQALSVLRVTFSPLRLNGLKGTENSGGENGIHNTYNSLTLNFSWDMLTEDLTTGERTTAQGNASYAFNGDPTLTPPSPTVKSQFFPVPPANTRLLMENLSISPASIDFLEIAPVFEVAL